MNSAPAVNQAPPLDQTYQAAVSDFNSAKYPLATSEFQDVVHYYPLDPTAGNAQFYLGEIAYRQHNYDDAVKAYNMVLEQYSGSSKASTAQLHKGLALISLSKRDAGVHELRTLIQRHPQTPEAQQARAKLNAMGVRISSTQR
jgi:tol-pal system protein YbgF